MVGGVAVVVGRVEKAKVLARQTTREASCWCDDESDTVACKCWKLGENTENEGGGEGENGAAVCGGILEGYWIVVKSVTCALFCVVGQVQESIGSDLC